MFVVLTEEVEGLVLVLVGVLVGFEIVGTVDIVGMVVVSAGVADTAVEMVEFEFVVVVEFVDKVVRMETAILPAY